MPKIDAVHGSFFWHPGATEWSKLHCSTRFCNYHGDKSTGNLSCALARLPPAFPDDNERRPECEVRVSGGFGVDEGHHGLLPEALLEVCARKRGDDRRTYGFDEFLDDEPVLARNNQYSRVEREAKRYFIKDNEADQHQKS